jgi:hypothetical protein
MNPGRVPVPATHALSAYVQFMYFGGEMQGAITAQAIMSSGIARPAMPDACR